MLDKTIEKILDFFLDNYIMRNLEKNSLFNKYTENT